MDKIYFAKLNENAKIPTKRLEDAGYDVYPCFEEGYMVIKPNETKLIPTGICSACSDDYAFILKERGSTGTKGMAQRCGVIDSGYRGEWFVPITNTTDETIVIVKPNVMLDGRNTTFYPYEKAICQFVLLPVPKVEVKELHYECLQNIKSERGEGKLGSSNK